MAQSDGRGPGIPSASPPDAAAPTSSGLAARSHRASALTPPTGGLVTLSNQHGMYQGTVSTMGPPSRVGALPVAHQAAVVTTNSPSGHASRRAASGEAGSIELRDAGEAAVLAAQGAAAGQFTTETMPRRQSDAATQWPPAASQPSVATTRRRFPGNMQRASWHHPGAAPNRTSPDPGAASSLSSTREDAASRGAGPPLSSSMPDGSLIEAASPPMTDGTGFDDTRRQWGQSSQGPGHNAAEPPSAVMRSFEDERNRSAARGRAMAPLPTSPDRHPPSGQTLPDTWAQSDDDGAFAGSSLPHAQPHTLRRGYSFAGPSTHTHFTTRVRTPTRSVVMPSQSYAGFADTRSPVAGSAIPAVPGHRAEGAVVVAPRPAPAAFAPPPAPTLPQGAAAPTQGALRFAPPTPPTPGLEGAAAAHTPRRRDSPSARAAPPFAAAVLALVVGGAVVGATGGPAAPLALVLHALAAACAAASYYCATSQRAQLASATQAQEQDSRGAALLAVTESRLRLQLSDERAALTLLCKRVRGSMQKSLTDFATATHSVTGGAGSHTLARALSTVYAYEAGILDLCLDAKALNELRSERCAVQHRRFDLHVLLERTCAEHAVAFARAGSAVAADIDVGTAPRFVVGDARVMHLVLCCLLRLAEVRVLARRRAASHSAHTAVAGGGEAPSVVLTLTTACGDAEDALHARLGMPRGHPVLTCRGERCHWERGSIARCLPPVAQRGTGAARSGIFPPTPPPGSDPPQPVSPPLNPLVEEEGCTRRGEGSVFPLLDPWAENERGAVTTEQAVAAMSGSEPLWPDRFRLSPSPGQDAPGVAPTASVDPAGARVAWAAAGETDPSAGAVTPAGEGGDGGDESVRSSRTSSRRLMSPPPPLRIPPAQSVAGVAVSRGMGGEAQARGVQASGAPWRSRAAAAGAPAQRDGAAGAAGSSPYPASAGRPARATGRSGFPVSPTEPEGSAGETRDDTGPPRSEFPSDSTAAPSIDLCVCVSDGGVGFLPEDFHATADHPGAALGAEPPTGSVAAALPLRSGVEHTAHVWSLLLDAALGALGGCSFYGPRARREGSWHGAALRVAVPASPGESAGRDLTDSDHDELRAWPWLRRAVVELQLARAASTLGPSRAWAGARRVPATAQSVAPPTRSACGFMALPWAVAGGAAPRVRGAAVVMLADAEAATWSVPSHASPPEDSDAVASESEPQGLWGVASTQFTPYHIMGPELDECLPLLCTRPSLEEAATALRTVLAGPQRVLARQLERPGWGLRSVHAAASRDELVEWITRDASLGVHSEPLSAPVHSGGTHHSPATPHTLHGTRSEPASLGASTHTAAGDDAESGRAAAAADAAEAYTLFVLNPFPLIPRETWTALWEKPVRDDGQALLKAALVAVKGLVAVYSGGIPRQDVIFVWAIPRVLGQLCSVTTIARFHHSLLALSRRAVVCEGTPTSRLLQDLLTGWEQPQLPGPGLTRGSSASSRSRSSPLRSRSWDADGSGERTQASARGPSPSQSQLERSSHRSEVDSEAGESLGTSMLATPPHEVAFRAMMGGRGRVDKGWDSPLLASIHSGAGETLRAAVSASPSTDSPSFLASSRSPLRSSSDGAAPGGAGAGRRVRHDEALAVTIRTSAGTTSHEASPWSAEGGAAHGSPQDVVGAARGGTGQAGSAAAPPALGPVLASPTGQGLDGPRKRPGGQAAAPRSAVHPHQHHHQHSAPNDGRGAATRPRRESLRLQLRVSGTARAAAGGTEDAAEPARQRTAARDSRQVRSRLLSMLLVGGSSQSLRGIASLVERAMRKSGAEVTECYSGATALGEMKRRARHFRDGYTHTLRALFTAEELAALGSVHPTSEGGGGRSDAGAAQPDRDTAQGTETAQTGVMDTATSLETGSVRIPLPWFDVVVLDGSVPDIESRAATVAAFRSVADSLMQRTVEPVRQHIKRVLESTGAQVPPVVHDALTALRALARRRPPVVLVTTNDSPSVQRKAREAGFEGVLCKPIHASVLRRYCRHLFTRSGRHSPGQTEQRRSASHWRSPAMGHSSQHGSRRGAGNAQPTSHHDARRYFASRLRDLPETSDVTDESAAPSVAGPGAEDDDDSAASAAGGGSVAAAPAVPAHGAGEGGYGRGSGGHAPKVWRREEGEVGATKSGGERQVGREVARPDGAEPSPNPSPSFQLLPSVLGLASELSSAREGGTSDSSTSRRQPMGEIDTESLPARAKAEAGAAAGEAAPSLPRAERGESGRSGIRAAIAQPESQSSSGGAAGANSPSSSSSSSGGCKNGSHSRSLTAPAPPHAQVGHATGMMASGHAPSPSGVASPLASLPAVTTAQLTPGGDDGGLDSSYAADLHKWRSARFDQPSADQHAPRTHSESLVGTPSAREAASSGVITPSHRQVVASGSPGYPPLHEQSSPSRGTEEEATSSPSGQQEQEEQEGAGQQQSQTEAGRTGSSGSASRDRSGRPTRGPPPASTRSGPPSPSLSSSASAMTLGSVHGPTIQNLLQPRGQGEGAVECDHVPRLGPDTVSEASDRAGVAPQQAVARERRGTPMSRRSSMHYGAPQSLLTSEASDAEGADALFVFKDGEGMAEGAGSGHSSSTVNSRFNRGLVALGLGAGDAVERSVYSNMSGSQMWGESSALGSATSGLVPSSSLDMVASDGDDVTAAPAGMVPGKEEEEEEKERRGRGEGGAGASAAAPPAGSHAK